MPLREEPRLLAEDAGDGDSNTTMATQVRGRVGKEEASTGPAAQGLIAADAEKGPRTKSPSDRDQGALPEIAFHGGLTIDQQQFVDWRAEKAFKRTLLQTDLLPKTAARIARPHPDPVALPASCAPLSIADRRADDAVAGIGGEEEEEKGAVGGNIDDEDQDAAGGKDFVLADCGGGSGEAAIVSAGEEGSYERDVGGKIDLEMLEELVKAGRKNKVLATISPKVNIRSLGVIESSKLKRHADVDDPGDDPGASSADKHEPQQSTDADELDLEIAQLERELAALTHGAGGKMDGQGEGAEADGVAGVEVGDGKGSRDVAETDPDAMFLAEARDGSHKGGRRATRRKDDLGKRKPSMKENSVASGRRNGCEVAGAGRDGKVKVQEGHGGGSMPLRGDKEDLGVWAQGDAVKRLFCHVSGEFRRREAGEGEEDAEGGSGVGVDLVEEALRRANEMLRSARDAGLG